MTGTTGYLRYPHLVGDRLVFAGEDDIWIASANGGTASRLTADRSPVSRPRLSPDGRTVAWTSSRAGSPEVFAMPVEGGLARQLTWFGSDRTDVLGFAPDGRLVVHSPAGEAFKSSRWAYAIDLGTGRIERLPYGPVTGVAWTNSGSVLLNTGQTRDAAEWKRYRGGTAGRFWLDSNGGGEFVEFLPEIIGQKTMPVTIGDRFAFLSDHEGHGNVYSVARDGSDLRRHTDHDTFWARQLSGDGTRLTYQCGGEIWRLDDLAADSRPVRVDIELTGPRTGRAPIEVNPAESLGDYSVDRTGRSSVIELRGQVVRLTTRNGPATVLADQPGVRYRQPVWLFAPEHPENDAENSGDSIVYVSSADGADALEIARPDGTRERFGSGRLGRVLSLSAAPNGRQLAVGSHDGRLLLVDADSHQITELARSGVDYFTGLAWSPDSAWLAYSLPHRHDSLRSIELIELATGDRVPVTGERFIDTDPVFSADGRYLAFLSVRTFDPVYDAQLFDLSFPVATRPYLVPLAASTPSPFDAEPDGRPATDDAPKIEPDTETVVDRDGLTERVVPFPVRAGRLEKLRAVKNGFAWLDKPIAGELAEARKPDDDIRPSVQRWDLVKRELLELSAHVDRAEPSADGSTLLLQDKEKLLLVPADRKPGDDDAITVDLSRVRLTVDPPAEWAQMLDETGRLMAENYWVEDMAGHDWPALVDRYRPLIDRIGSRDDLSDVLWELNGETGTSHAYEMPKPAKPDPRLAPAFLGADLEHDGERWRLGRIVAGDSSASKARSPLTAPGVGLVRGDALLAVNGRAIDERGPAPLLRGLGGKPVELSVEHDGVRRTVAITPLANEEELRYLDWVASRRALVHERSGGRLGYLHIPDMVSTGWAAFHRDLIVEAGRDGLVFDTRWNNGGHTSQLVLEKLARRTLARVTARHGETQSYPADGPQGPLVSLTNEWAGSDGDIVNAAIQTLGLGPVIGRRTWGGVIGIDGRYRLTDGTRVTQPKYSFWFTKFGWSVENYGVDPDIVVELPPQAWAAGADPQLEAGIDYLLAELDRRAPRPEPDLATRPNRAAPVLPPRP